MPSVTRGDDAQLLQTKLLQGMLSQCDVRNVGRVKCPTKYAESWLVAHALKLMCLERTRQPVLWLQKVV